MQVAVFGIKGDLSHREKIQSQFLPLLENSMLELCLIPLITCNRFEIYFYATDLNKVHCQLVALAKKCGIHKGFYVYFQKGCFMHLCKTAAGLDSVIIGESEIQRQVKKAYLSKAVQKLPSVLHFLFQKALKVSKNLRTHYLLEKNSPRLDRFLAKKIKSTFRAPSILFIGNSEINNMVMSFFEKSLLHNCFIASRFPIEKSKKQISWDSLHLWPSFDVIICGSKYAGFCVDYQKVPSKTLIFDLSVPRCVSPEVKKDQNVSLLNIDEIHALIQSKKTSDERKYEEIIEKEVNKLVGLFAKKESFKLAMQEKVG
ncbi:MAG: hypothetical protein COT84_00325 [Chlamydiae bacterium CG10_big_fil_rev_8_21_14_0_10_35_9]|nr:MAG: hypothetical protein COT84_00325 [Chlamydiae bacterium CG10_big_fil_rev_8_21_14_0_10_35_9]